MNKWLENDVVLRLISVGVAIMLWLGVTDASVFYASDDSYSTRIRDVSVEAVYDKDRFELVQNPGKVELTLYGDKFTLDRLPSTYRIYVDLRKLGAGTHRVPVHVEGLPAGVKEKVSPSTLKVELESKLQREMPVQVDLIGKLPEGATAEKPIVNPEKVLVRGSESKLDQVSAVKAIVPLSETAKSVNKLIKLQAFGENGPINEVDVYPETVRVEIAINSPNKKVPFHIEIGKGPPSGYAVESIQPSIDQLTVYGPRSYIDSLQYYPGPSLNLSNITKDVTIQVPIPVRDEATKVEPQEVEIYVKMVRAETKNIGEVPLQLTGIAEGMTAKILSPEGGNVNIILSGAPNNLGQVSTGDIKAYVDVSNLPAGKHEVPIQFTLPPYIQVHGQLHLTAEVQLSPS
ncbi:CdaR family protein [Lihuaxuella thermophila]|uniref:YbbR domain-containing protein n=1 Tax=Lihuaxuella thermophila TaxID=1173111 RepID=A0A1H8G2I3_9BACL|nr:CdaR family protein [Lihuaxuella thermophila]SEN38196.1 YbbR domain-containing protein [Lihuaxuella thermophila]